MNDINVSARLEWRRTALLACHRIAMYNDNSIKKEEGPRAPSRKVVYSESWRKSHVHHSRLFTGVQGRKQFFCQHQGSTACVPVLRREAMLQGLPEADHAP